VGVDSLMVHLRQEYPDMTWVKRIRFGGLLDIPDEHGETRSQGPVAGMGVDLLSPESTEIMRLNIEKSVVKGRLPERRNEVLISDRLADKLGVSLGDPATLLGSTMYGSMAMHNFIVVGTVRFGVTVLDRGAMIADVTDVQRALDMVNAAGEILGYSDTGVYDDQRAVQIVDSFNSGYRTNDNEFAPTMGRLKELSNLGEYLDLASNFAGIIVAVFVVVMSIVLWNAGLLGGLRRYGEVGIRLAIGEHKGHVYRSLIYESVFIGFAGSVIGTGIGLGFAYWLQTKGLDISSLMKDISMMVPTVFRASVTSETYYIGFIPGLFSTVLGTSLSGIGIYRRQTAQLFKELEA
ncbi:MAG: ABC transporter permease, partial [Fidelibacterota bacterium]